MGKVTFNDRFFEQVGTDPRTVSILVGIAGRVAARAKTTGPKDTKDYVNGIKVSTRRSRYRTVAVVTAHDKKSLLVEARTSNLLKALRAERRRG